MNQGPVDKFTASLKQKTPAFAGASYKLESDMQYSYDPKPIGSSPLPSFPLALAGEGERVKIVHFHNGAQMRERLLSMGICLDDEIEIIQRQQGGAILIEKTGNRYAFGGGMAHKINVTRC